MMQINSWTGTPGSGIVVTSPGFGSGESRQHPLLAAITRLAQYFEVTEDEVMDAYPSNEELIKEGAKIIATK